MLADALQADLAIGYPHDPAEVEEFAKYLEQCIELARRICRDAKGRFAPCGSSGAGPAQRIKEKRKRAPKHSNAESLNEMFSGPATVHRYSPTAGDGIFQGPLTDAQITALSGAPTGADIGIDSRYSGQVTIHVEGPHIAGSQRRELKKLSNGDLVAENKFFQTADDSPEGYGAHSLGSQVKALQELGVKRIETDAIGAANDPRWKGYLVWPKLGFDAPLYPADIAMLPKSIKNCKTVQDAMRSKTGRDWWEAKGTGRPMVFDLKEGSRSIKKLRKYFADKGYIFDV